MLRLILLAALVGVLAAVLVRALSGVRLSPRARAMLAGAGLQALRVFLLRSALPLLLRLLRVFR